MHVGSGNKEGQNVGQVSMTNIDYRQSQGLQNTPFTILQDTRNRPFTRMADLVILIDMGRQPYKC